MGAVCCVPSVNPTSWTHPNSPHRRGRSACFEQVDASSSSCEQPDTCGSDSVSPRNHLQSGVGALRPRLNGGAQDVTNRHFQPGIGNQVSTMSVVDAQTLGINRMEYRRNQAVVESAKVAPAKVESRIDDREQAKLLPLRRRSDPGPGSYKHKTNLNAESLLELEADAEIGLVQDEEDVYAETELQMSQQHEGAIVNAEERYAQKLITVVYNPRLLEMIGRGWTDSEICRVHNLHTQRWEVALPGGADLLNFTAWQLKRSLEDAHGICADDQVLRFKGRVIENEEPLVSCGVIAGCSVLIGLWLPPKTETTNSAPSANTTCTAMRSQGSLTEVMVDAQEQNHNRSSKEPWWTGSTTSGPLGAHAQNRHSPMQPEPKAGAAYDEGRSSNEAEVGASKELTAPVSQPSEAWWIGSRTSGPRGGARQVAGEINTTDAEVPCPDELRRMRLARFGAK